MGIKPDVSRECGGDIKDFVSNQSLVQHSQPVVLHTIKITDFCHNVEIFLHFCFLFLFRLDPVEIIHRCTLIKSYFCHVKKNSKFLFFILKSRSRANFCSGNLDELTFDLSVTFRKRNTKWESETAIKSELVQGLRSQSHIKCKFLQDLGRLLWHLAGRTSLHKNSASVQHLHCSWPTFLTCLATLKRQNQINISLKIQEHG